MFDAEMHGQACHARILYSLAIALMVVFADPEIRALWVWTGFPSFLGIAIAAFATHFLLRVCEIQRDG
jgi:hypothetical protein